MRIPFAIPERTLRPHDLVGFGENSVDLVAVVEAGASAGKREIAEFARLPGGQIATAMAACARLGWRARYIGSFGAEELGRISRDSLIADGVDVSAARTVAGVTNRFAIILVDADSGDRTVLWRRDPALNMAWGDDDAGLRSAATSGRLLLVDCENPAASLAAARAARRAGIPTMVDVDSVQPETNALLQEIDVIIAAEEFPRALTGYDDTGRALEAIAREFAARIVCVTLGERGSLARCQGREIRTAAFPVSVVDTTGAGDAFRAGFASACLRSPDGAVEDVLDYANAVAALNCRGLGARGGLPTAEEVEAQLLAGRASL